MVFKLCTGVEKMLKLKLEKVLGVIIDVRRSSGEKLAGGFFDRQPPYPHSEYCKVTAFNSVC